MLDRKTCEDILARVLNRSRADETLAVLQYSQSSAIRIGGNRLLNASEAEDTELQITVRSDNHYATGTCNDLSEKALGTMLDALLALAGENPASAEIQHFPSSAVIIEAPLHRSEAGAITNRQRVDAAAEIIDTARNAGLLASGSITTSENVVVVGNSNGLFLHQPSSLLHAQFRVYNADGSSTGYAQQYTADFMEFKPAVFISRAIDKCLAWKNPIDLDVSRLTTVFEPEAIADLMLPFMQQFSQQAVAEDRSFIRRLDGTSFVGHRMMDSKVTIRSNPFHETLPALPFTMDGYEVRPVQWVKEGVINQISLDPAVALRYQSEAIPLPTNWIVEGGESTLEDIIAETSRGLLVSGFSAISLADPKNCLLTGSTRDGLFLIENGSITSAVKNLYFRETPLYLFRELEAIGVSKAVSPTNTYFPMLLPPLRSKDVMFSRHSGLI